MATLRPGVAVLWNYEVAAGKKEREDNWALARTRRQAAARQRDFLAPAHLAKSLDHPLFGLRNHVHHCVPMAAISADDNGACLLRP
jgi:hypothetical protein